MSQHSATIALAHPSPHRPAAAIPTNDNCPLRHSLADCYIVHTRHSSEGWNPACATAERTRGGGDTVVPAQAGTSHPGPPAPVIPAKAGIQARVRVRGGNATKCNQMQPNATEIKVSPLLATPEPPSFQRRLESSVRRHTLRIRTPHNLWFSPLALWERARVRVREGHAGVMQTNDNCPLCHRSADCYIVRIRRSRAGGNLASRPPADPLALWERVRVRVRGGQCNQMQPNATKCNRIKGFATPGHS